jgi:HEPN domain-containing protein
MDKTEKFSYWLDIAEYDLNTADAMFKSGRFLYVAFMCQQSLEKLAKGLYNYYIDDSVPRVHNISFIVDKVLEVLKIKLAESSYELFDRLAAYYLQGRYPSFKEEIAKMIDESQAQILLEETKEVFQWMKSLKK